LCFSFNFCFIELPDNIAMDATLYDPTIGKCDDGLQNDIDSENEDNSEMDTDEGDSVRSCCFINVFVNAIYDLFFAGFRYFNRSYEKDDWW
jgi:hypothetical protein